MFTHSDVVHAVNRARSDSNLEYIGDYSPMQPKEIIKEKYARAAGACCGNPTALATWNLGGVVLDLGSGGGIDVLLSARRVASTFIGATKPDSTAH